MTNITATAHSPATVLDAVQALPIVLASDMIRAQGYVPTADERAVIVALADLFEGMGLSRRVSVKVCDFDGVRIGSLEFHV